MSMPISDPNSGFSGLDSGSDDSFHTVQFGETLSSIARDHEVDLADLLSANPRFQSQPDFVRAGDVVVIPQSASTPTDYIVRAGDTVTDIANRFGTTNHQMMEMNPSLRANPDMIFPGQLLQVSSQPTQNPATYTVQAGDSLSRIADRFEVDLGALLDLNPRFQSNPDLIRAGDVVNIPPRGAVAPEPVPEPVPAPTPTPAPAPAPADPAPPEATGRPVLSRGAEGTEVEELQNLLTQAGFNPGTPDGDFGPMTESAVRAFQAAEGLPANGIVNEATWSVLAERAESPVALPEPTTPTTFEQIPETQVFSNNRPVIDTPVPNYDQLLITGGFMEDHGHSNKPETRVVFADAPGVVQTLPPSDRNLGIDFVPLDSAGNVDWDARAWFGGEVTHVRSEGGYGRRVTVATDQTYTIDGQAFQVHAGYAHLAGYDVSVGDQLNAGDLLGTMGGSAVVGGVLRDNHFGAHVDLRTWIEHPTLGRVDISPNLLVEQEYGAVGPVAPVPGTTPTVADANAVLFDYNPTGASARTAAQDNLGVVGVAASEALAATDYDRVNQYRDVFEEIAARHDVPPALLAAIASRESRGGAVLDANGRGDRGNAFGIMQVDQRFHTIQGEPDPASEAHIEQAAEILADFLTGVERNHPDWAPERQLQGAVTAYNSGLGNVQTLAGMDNGTTGNDYSNDTWARARYYAERWGQ